jgi:hypothetical protein
MLLIAAIAVWLIAFVSVVGAVSSISPVGGVAIAALIIAKTLNDLTN